MISSWVPSGSRHLIWIPGYCTLILGHNLLDPVWTCLLPIQWGVNWFNLSCSCCFFTCAISVGLSGTPNNGTPYQYYSHTTPIRIPKDMGMVWVPLDIRGSHYWESLESPLTIVTLPESNICRTWKWMKMGNYLDFGAGWPTNWWKDAPILIEHFFS